MSAFSRKAPSKCCPCAFAATRVPLGMRVPSLSVTSLTAFGGMETTARRAVKSAIRAGAKMKLVRAITRGGAVVAECFPEDAVEFPHLPQCGARPSVRRDYRLYLFQERSDEFRIFGEIVEYVTDDIKRLPKTYSV